MLPDRLDPFGFDAPTPRPWRRVGISGFAVCFSTMILALSAQGPVFADAAPDDTKPTVQKVKSIAVEPVPVVAPASGRLSVKKAPAAAVKWPGAGSAVVNLAAGGVDPEAVAARTLPVVVRPVARAHRVLAAADVSKVRIDLLDRAKLPEGLSDGVVLRLDRADGVARAGAAEVGIDYSSFARAYGAGWSDRLALYSLPECAVSGASTGSCPAGRRLNSVNDPRAHLVRADVTMPGGGTGTLLMLAAAPSGPSGDNAATPLTPSSNWSSGGNSGTFSWDYPLRTPPGLGGPTPKLAFSYSSASVDGKSATTNNQPSWIGEGFDYWPGYIERRYAPCSDDNDVKGANNPADSGDMCFATWNAVLSLNGKSSELVRVGSTDQYRLKEDDGSTVERLTGAANGDSGGSEDTGEHWRVTTSDGVQYYFGLNRLPGYTGTGAAAATTDSVWTLPVAGNHAGEPCHQDSFAKSFCDQAWRWNLDYVVDTHGSPSADGKSVRGGNTMSMWYSKEQNRYARNNSTTDAAEYTRGGVLKRIDYGTNDRSGTDTVYTAARAPMSVEFTAGDRCEANCGVHSWTTWPDTPWDQQCTAKPCTKSFAPTFWTTRRLAAVSTKVWDAGRNDYKVVDQWTLTHGFPPVGDAPDLGLWLSSVAHTGKTTGSGVVGGDQKLDAVTFDPIQLANRVDFNDDHKQAMNRLRINKIVTESGGQIAVEYRKPQCSPTNKPGKPEDNNLLCYPSFMPDPTNPKKLDVDYIHKYVVDSVTETDLTGGNSSKVTRYEYGGSPAWRHADDDGITPDKLRTWSEFRGFRSVTTRVGDSADPTSTLSVSTYFQGMAGDLDGSPHGGKRTPVPLAAVDLNADGDTADVAGADARAVSDEDAFSGMVRQTTLYDGDLSRPVSTTVNEPWQSAPTASHDMGDTTTLARHVNTAVTWNGTFLESGRATVTRTDTSFDSYGMAERVSNAGDTAVAGDETCTRTTYARNVAHNLLSLPGMVETDALTCDKTPASDKDVVSATRTSYDGKAYGVAPMTDLATAMEEAKGWSSDGPDWMITETKSYDDYGRVALATDERGNKTTTTYEPTAGGPVTKVKTTNSLTWTTETQLEPAWGLAYVSIDVNGRRTDSEFDALGRLRNVWLANRPKSSNAGAPSVAYEYDVHNNAPSVVTTKALNADRNYVTTYALYDGLLRPRETQLLSAAGDHKGTVFTETKYDKHGRSRLTATYFNADVSPGKKLFTTPDWAPLRENVTEYDRADRVTAAVTVAAGQEKWRTTNRYSGGRVSVSPPAGGTATTTISDAQGRTVELRQYHDMSTVGSDQRALYDQLTYHYDAKGRRDRVTDNAGNKWTYSYDFLGREVAGHDPDKGDTTSTFNDWGDQLTSTGADGTTLAYTYDGFGRKTGLYTPDATGTKLATWRYDGTTGRGQLLSSSRWVKQPDGTSAEFSVSIPSYSSLYKPNGAIYRIPETPDTAGLAGEYQTSFGYSPDGAPSSQGYPAVPGFSGAETVSLGHDAVTGRPKQLLTNHQDNGSYITDTDYTAYGELGLLDFGLAGAGTVRRTAVYDDVTGHTNSTLTWGSRLGKAIDGTALSYDAAGNVIKLTESTRPDIATQTDTQCFTYDYARRLREAWTPKSGECNAAPQASELGGPAPYWQSWAFDAVGNRASETNHADAGDVTSIYSYPAPGGTRPHAVSSVTTGSKRDDYSYDPSGATTSRPGAAGPQTLAWTPEGKLESLTEAGKSTRYIYDADGSRLLVKDDASTTLYLPGTEVRKDNKTGVSISTRFYSFGGQTVAMRRSDSNRTTFLCGDRNGTDVLAVDADSQEVGHRWFNPFGTVRGAGSVVPWLSPRGFVGGDTDPTGLTHLGAREYDPGIGRFVSVDPLTDLDDPQQLNAYGYSDNDPVNRADPTGLMSAGACATKECYDEITQASASATQNAANHCATQSCYQSIKDNDCHCTDSYSPSGHAHIPPIHHKPKPTCSGFWACTAHYAKATMDVISDISPIIDIAAIVLAPVPILGEVMFVVAVVVDVISVVDSTINAVGEYKEHGFSKAFAVDVAGAALGTVGLGGAGAASKVEKQLFKEGAYTELKSAAKSAAKRKPGDSYAAKSREHLADITSKIDHAQTMKSRSLALGTASGLGSDLNTQMCNVAATCEGGFAFGDIPGMYGN